MMSYYEILVGQFLAHFFSDFIFQNGKTALEKNKKGFLSKYLYIHVGISIFTSFVLSRRWEFITASVAIGIIHGLIDGLKSIFIRYKLGLKYIFYIDQILHLLSIYIVVRLYYGYWGETPVEWFPVDLHYSLLALGFIVTSKPANILIKEIIKTFSISVPGAPNELPNAGKLIGTLERWLVLTFLLIGQYEAVGFLLASKSILRYGDRDSQQPEKTEYVLIGTMLSFGIAIAVALLLGKIR